MPLRTGKKRGVHVPQWGPLFVIGSDIESRFIHHGYISKQAEPAEIGRPPWYHTRLSYKVKKLISIDVRMLQVSHIWKETQDNPSSRACLMLMIKQPVSSLLEQELHDLGMLNAYD